MDHILQSMMHTLEERQQLHVLLRKAHTMVVFSSETGKWHLFLSNREVHTHYTDKGTYRVSIIGEEEDLLKIIKGTASLRQLQKQNKVKLQGNYRQILLLEAILLLSSEREVV
ncbi:SCP2 sterol-binding domain-containing protein [Bacillus testis]|uniref:SCP2 sterol-binding domain-containing protein n=1 Tax=Bacillus testis TaxID=1622072 RepID=UPI00067F2F54|nr:SCP2 sterol-binding domain-containing protein [Bacillus testis]